MTDIVERLNDSLSAGYSELRKEAAVEIMRLRAKITEMERQEPVAWMPLATKAALEAGGTGVVWNRRDRGIADEPLYALPGAKGEEK